MTRRWSSRLSGLAGSERGSASPALELVIITPMIVALLLVGIAAGRTATGQSRVQQAAAAAARAATGQHEAAEAGSAATNVAVSSLADQGIDCRDLDITLDTAGFATPPGAPAHVTVTIDCVVSWSDLAIPGWPGTHTVTGTAVSALDPQREVIP